MSKLGQRILASLQEAVDGNFARVTIDGQTWTREDADLRARLASADKQRDRYAKKWIDAVAERDAAVKRAGDLTDLLAKIAHSSAQCGADALKMRQIAMDYFAAIRQLSERG